MAARCWFGILTGGRERHEYVEGTERTAVAGIWRRLGFGCWPGGEAAFAEEVVGQPEPVGVGPAAVGVPVMDSIIRFHDGLVVIITAITLFVLALLIMVMLKFNARANPVPSRTTHNTTIEVAWTLIPVLILVSYRRAVVPAAVSGAGHSQGRSDDQGDRQAVVLELRLSGQRQVRVRFAARRDKQPRLLGVDNELVVPVNKVVVVQVTGADVIHSFAIPAFGIKIDAIPGRLNETWFKATKTGMFYGQCSELCGGITPSCRSRCGW